jgi:VWFA-related protein
MIFLTARLKKLFSAHALATSFLLSFNGFSGGILLAQGTKVAPDAEQGPKIQVTVKEVIIPVVVRDASGHVLGSLTKDQFQVLDRGKPRLISGFAIQRRSPEGAATSAGLPTRAPKSAPTPAPTAAHRFIVILFDNLHMEEAEVLRTRVLATNVLGEAQGRADAVAVLSTSGVNSGFTQDQAKLADAIEKVQAQRLYRHTEHECPDVDYYLADQIVNHRSETALESAIQDYETCANLTGSTRAMAEHMVESVARRALELGDQDVRVTLSIVREVVREMGTLPGERSLILISSGFLTPTAEAMTLKSQIMDVAASANVTINALDARGLYSTEIDASRQGASSTLALLTGADSAAHRTKTVSGENVMAELSDGTGGTYFHNSNDLTGGLRRLISSPEYVYVLECQLQDVKQDGSYHRLTVKVAATKVTIQARAGYYAPKRARAKN